MKYSGRIIQLHRNSHGFTTIELVVVMAIMGILMAIAIPNYSEWAANYRLKALARDIYSNFQKAKIEAIKTNSNVIISFDVPGQRYQVFVDNGGTTGTADDNTLNGDEKVLDTIMMPGGFVLENPNFMGFTTTGFDARGLTEGSKAGSVQVKNSYNQRYQINLSVAGCLTLVRL